MTEQSLWVPLGVKGWMNSNQRMHWRARAAWTKAWREETGWLAHYYKLQPMDQAHIVCELHFDDKRRRDPGNWAPTAKACVDGIVDAGILLDDSHHYLTGPDMRIGDVVTRNQRGVRVLLYPRWT